MNEFVICIKNRECFFLFSKNKTNKTKPEKTNRQKDVIMIIMQKHFNMLIINKGDDN